MYHGDPSTVYSAFRTEHPEGYIPPLEELLHYVAVKRLDDGRWCAVIRLMWHYSLVVDLSEVGWEDKWCIDTREHAEEALLSWDGTGEPLHWHKHFLGRMRRNPETDERWSEDEPRPSR